MAITPLMPVYPRCDVRPVRGEGCYLIGERGERYLDFASGIAVNLLGHGHPALTKAIADQAATLMHVSNLYGSPQGEKFAQRLVDTTFADTVFFTNSGAEAVECAIKTARRYHYANGNPGRHKIISFANAFHGRTLGTISATNQPKMREGFEPLLPGFEVVAFNDLAAAEAAIDDATAGFLVEPVQGEGGILPATQAFLQGLRKLADERGLLLILDEVQCGYARTGTFFAHEQYGITPDIMAAAKGIGGGFPLGACLATEEAAKGMVFGTHGSTYGGNPLAMAAGEAVMDVVANDAFLEGVRQKGERLRQALEQLIPNHDHLFESVRGLGLMLGIRLKSDSRAFVAHLRDNHGLLTVAAGDNVVRILPPLVIEQNHIDECIEKLSAGARSYQGAGVMTRHFLDLADAGGDAIAAMLADALDRKTARAGWPKGKVDADAPLAGYTLAMIFEKNSTRTRVSFDMAMRQLGGTTIVMDAGLMQLGRGETIADTARVLSRYVDAIMIRTDDHAKIIEMAEHATVPVINGLTDHSHPCQIMADMLTVLDRTGALAGTRWAWLGDGNNVLHSIIEAGSIMHFDVRVGCPHGYDPSMEVLEAALKRGATVQIVRDAAKAVADADVVVTDTWISMGQAHAEAKLEAMAPYQVTPAIMAAAAPDAVFLHCLPAHRGEEVTEAVIDGPASAVWDEAENRLHAQKSVLLWCLGMIGEG